MKTIQNGRARSGFWAVLAGFCLWLAAGAAQAGNTCTWTGSWDVPPANTDDVIVVASGGNLTWSSSMPSNVASWTQQATYTGTATFQTVYGATGFTNFTVSGDVALLGGAWTHTNNTTAETYWLRVTVGGNLLITNAAITADIIGYNKQYGYGAPTIPSANQAGGAYGGAAAGGDILVNTRVYGSIVSPTNIGSGGGGGKGGGAIFLSVAGTTTVASATLTANGESQASSSAGSGGSVFLTTGWLNGNGTLRANGGSGANTGWGGGSGGRVAIVLTGASADFGNWKGTNTAYGGGGGGDNAQYMGGGSAAGTVYRKTQAGTDTLMIDNGGNGIFGQASTLMPPGVNLNGFSSVAITNKGILGVGGDTTVDFGSFAPTVYGPANSYIAIDSDTNVTYPATWVVNGYTLYMNNITSNKMTNLTVGTNGVLSHYANNSAETYKLRLAIAGNLTVMSNGLITADYLGYGKTAGQGASSSTNGGTYGGTAVYGNQNTYGVILAPTNLGSGGAGNYVSGGGAIQLTVAGTTTVASAGVISANGASSTGNGGTPGGSIFLTTGWLMGSGTLQANGGTGPSGNHSGGGSGGRVAIILTGAGANFSSWSGTNVAFGGPTWAAAAAGTVYRQTTAQTAGAGTIIVDNGTTGTNSTYTPLPAFSSSTENIGRTAWVSTNNARIGLVTNTAVASLTLNANGFLELNGHTLTVKTLTVTNRVYNGGTYGPSFKPLSALTDSGSGGKVVVPPKGTVFYFR